MARPIPRPEPVISATRSLSTIRTTRIEGRKPLEQAGARCCPRMLRHAGRELYFGSDANPQLRIYYGLTVFTWARFQAFFCGPPFMFSLNSLHSSRCLVLCLVQPLTLISRTKLMQRIQFPYSMIAILVAFSLAGCSGYGSGSVNGGAIAPYINTQPANQTVSVGQTATFSVGAAGTPPLTYQWQKNGPDIPGATSSSYTTPATTSADSGAMFRVVITNSAGSVTSNSATLTVSTGPVGSTVGVIT